MARKQVNQVAVEPEEKAPEAAVVSFEDFLKEREYHSGLIASFMYEASQGADGMKPRTEDEWRLALEEQANKTY